METIVENFHFIRPWALLLIPLCLLSFWVLLHSEKRNSQWRTLIDKRLLPYLLEGNISQAKQFPYYAFLILLIALCLALAGPAWEKQPQPIQRDTSALVILWDLSPSMYAQDIKPSRVVRARLKLSDLLDERKEGLTALIAYSGDAHVVTPLTDDTKTIKNLLTGLSPAIMPLKGSNPEHALRNAIELIKDSNIDKGDIVFITDDIPYSAFTELNTLSSETKHRITVWGIGKSEGAPIPLPNGGFAKNSRGEIVVARVDHNALSEAAVKMGGTYIPFSNDHSDIESIVHFGFQAENMALSDSQPKPERMIDQWKEVGHWIVLFCLPFAALAFRRGWLMCLIIGFTLQPERVMAFEWQALWYNKDQQAQKLLQENQADAAAETFQDKNWKAIANYKSGNFEDAQKHFESTSDTESLYNLGNSLTHQGRYDDAIAAYEKALGEKQDFPEAEQNLQIARQLKALEEQQQNQQGQDSDQSDADQEESEQEKGEQNKADQDSQQDGEQSQNQDGQNQQSESQEQQNQNNSKDGEQDSDAQPQQAQEQEEQTKEALKQHYQQDKEETAEQKEARAQQQEKSSDNTDEPNTQAIAEVQLSPEEQEQQQALKQWLRRVPDDPSGLLREKFKYEHNKRRRENFDQGLRMPEGATNEERW
ncbi:MAG: VWA domain-containing protein [Agarilytica sp.]